MKIYQGHRWVRERQDVRDCHPVSCRFFFFFFSLPWQTILEGSRQGWFTSWPHLVPAQAVLSCAPLDWSQPARALAHTWPCPLFSFFPPSLLHSCFLDALYAFLPRLKRKLSLLFLVWPLFFFFPSPPPSSPSSSFSPWVKERTMGEGAHKLKNKLIWNRKSPMRLL